MAAPFLHFLYPPLFRAVESPAGVRSASHLKSNASRRKYHASINRKQEAFAQRYGPAAEQAPPPIMTKTQAEQSKRPPENDQPGSREARSRKEPEKKAERQKSKFDGSLALASEGLAKIQDVDPNPQPSSTDPRALEAEAKRLHESAQTAKDNGPRPLDKVLHMQAPTESPISTGKEHSSKGSSSKAPHLHAPPYVHHFDSFGLVKDLEKGGFQLNQAETLMKAVRSLLAVNLDVAKEGMVSKSDRENVRWPAILHPLSPLLYSFYVNLSNPSTGKLSLPRRLLRAPYRNCQHAARRRLEAAHRARPPPARSRHPLPAHHARDPRAEG